MKPETPPAGLVPLHVPRRFRTREVRIGNLVIGGDRPILIQSMTISDTRDTDAVVSEVRQLVDAGCPLVRVTAPSIAEAENIREIRRRLAADGIRVPMVADIHFTPNAALAAADIVEKVRINPGNYADRKKFKVFEISDSDYALELERIRDRFLPLVEKLKTNGAALRIGTNHGSLSDRIMNRFGDTPQGMVESALEFVRICRDVGYHEIVLSMKSSIPSVMIAAYRLLVQRMAAEGMDYPIHLGVTEAGNGLEGRVKSAVGIGSLLATGIGDTIRVSLTEDAYHELPACRNILEAIALERNPSFDEEQEGRDAERSARAGAWIETDAWKTLPARSDQVRRSTSPWQLRSLEVGGGALPAVELRVPWETLVTGRVPASLAGAVARAGGELGAELLSAALPAGSDDDAAREVLASRERWPAALGELPFLLELPPGEDHDLLDAVLPLVDAVGLPGDIASAAAQAQRVAAAGRVVRWRLDGTSNPAPPATQLDRISRAAGVRGAFLLSPGGGHVSRLRALVAALDEERDGEDLAPVWLEAPADGASMPLWVGTALTEGVGDGVCLLVPPVAPASIECAPPWPSGGVDWHVEADGMAYRVLQACRVRLTRAEFIACPSCGRTQFDLQTTTARIRARTEHLKGVKLAIMGCIVNGPGEMADADFGYVGSGRGKVDLYVGKERVEKNIPEAEAEDRLIALLDEHGAWVEP